MLKTIPTGRGVFHMWATQEDELLLVNNDIDKTVTVIDTNSLIVSKTLSLPSDLLASGFKPQLSRKKVVGIHICLSHF